MSNIIGFYLYNNIFVLTDVFNVGIITFANSSGNTIGTNFISKNNIYHFKGGSSMNIYAGSIDTNLPSGGLTSAQSGGLEIGSFQSTSTGDYLQFVDYANNNYQLMESSPARNKAYMLQAPLKDYNNYTRDTVTTDIGPFDFDGIAPILPIPVMKIYIGGVLRTGAFGAGVGVPVTFVSESLYSDLTTLEIFNSLNQVITSASSFPYIYSFTASGIYSVRFRVTNVDGSAILDYPGYATIDILPTAAFTLTNPPILLNGNLASLSVTNASIGGNTASGGITDNLWEIVDGNNIVDYNSTSTNLTVTGAALQQKTYTLKLTVTNLVGSNTKTVSNAIVVNKVPVEQNNTAPLIGVRYVLFEYIIPNDLFIDAGQTVTYSIISKPIWLSYNNITRTLSGTPPEPGTYIITVRGSDSLALYADTQLTLNVGSGSAPVINKQPVTKSIRVGGQFYYKLPNNIFVEQNLLYITFVSLPTWIINEGTIIYGEPTINDLGIHTITIRGYDGFLETLCTFNIEVIDMEILSIIQNGEALSSVRNKLNKLLSFVNKIV